MTNDEIDSFPWFVDDDDAVVVVGLSLAATPGREQVGEYILLSCWVVVVVVYSVQ